MDAPLGLRRGDALDPMHAGLKLERAVDAASFDPRGGFLHPSSPCVRHIQDFRLPSPRFCIPQVHAQQLACEERGFLAPRPRPHLHDDAAVVIGILRQQVLPHPAFQVADLRPRFLRLLCGESGEHGILPRGLRVIDVSIPAEPEEVAAYDTAREAGRYPLG